MSFRLVTVEDVKSQLVYDDALSDTQLQFRLDAVSQVIMDYIGSPATDVLDDWTDSSGNVLVDSTGDPATATDGSSLVPGNVRAATICALAAWDEDRKADLITPAVISLLSQFREPTVS